MSICVCVYASMFKYRRWQLQRVVSGRFWGFTCKSVVSSSRVNLVNFHHFYIFTTSTTICFEEVAETQHQSPTQTFLLQHSQHNKIILQSYKQQWKFITLFYCVVSIGVYELSKSVGVGDMHCQNTTTYSLQSHLKQNIFLLQMEQR